MMELMPTTMKPEFEFAASNDKSAPDATVVVTVDKKVVGAIKPVKGGWAYVEKNGREPFPSYNVSFEVVQREVTKFLERPVKFPMKNFKLSKVRSGIEVLILKLTAEMPDGTVVSKDLDFGGNAKSAVWHGAESIVQALNELAEG
jgi:hypothetical protein